LVKPPVGALSRRSGKRLLRIYMRAVYLLEYVRISEDGDQNVKCIGVYSSLQQAEAAIERAKLIPGLKTILKDFVSTNMK